jgi:hypothetical protein
MPIISKPEDILMPVVLPELRVSLTKLPHTSLSQRSSSSKNIRSKLLEKKNDEGRRSDSVEIKLDGLKASEIETLLKDMFKISSGHPSSASALLSTCDTDITAPRRSYRKSKQRFEHANVEEGTDPNEFSDHGFEPSGRKRKNNNPSEDPDFRTEIKKVRSFKATACSDTEKEKNSYPLEKSKTEVRRIHRKTQVRNEDGFVEEREQEITWRKPSYICRLCSVECNNHRRYCEVKMKNNPFFFPFLKVLICLLICILNISAHEGNPRQL